MQMMVEDNEHEVEDPDNPGAMIPSAEYKALRNEYKVLLKRKCPAEAAVAGPPPPPRPPVVLQQQTPT